MSSKKDKIIKIIEIVVELGGVVLTVVAIFGSLFNKDKRR